MSDVINGAASHMLGITSSWKKRKERLENARQKKAKHRRPLSSPLAAKILAIAAVLFILIWVSFTILAMFKISEIRTALPNLGEAGQFLSSRLKTSIGSNNINGAKHVFLPGGFNMVPSISERVPLIDMRRLSATLPFDNPDGGAWKQGWDVQPVVPSKTNPVKIFVVPHSHCGSESTV